MLKLAIATLKQHPESMHQFISKKSNSPVEVSEALQKAMYDVFNKYQQQAKDQVRASLWWDN